MRRPHLNTSHFPVKTAGTAHSGIPPTGSQLTMKWQQPPAREIKRKEKESEEKCLCATDRCSSWLASAWLYSASRRCRGRLCTADILRGSHGWSWLECLLHRGGSTTVPENRRRTTWLTSGRESLRPCTQERGGGEQDCQKLLCYQHETDEVLKQRFNRPLSYCINIRSNTTWSAAL